MAAPQRQFSADAGLTPAPQPQLQKPAPAPRKSPSPRRWRFGYAWILLCLILAFWYVGFGWSNSGGWIWGNHNASVTVANNGGLGGSGVVILEVANKQDYIGQSFQIQNVSVDHWSGNRAVWIGSRHSYLPMLLIFPSASPLAPKTASAASSGALPESAPSASAAPTGVQHLDVTGRIVKAPPSAQAQQEWKLSDDDVDQLEQEGVYIQATTVQAAKHQL